MGKYKGKKKIKRSTRAISKFEKFIYGLLMTISIIIAIALSVYCIALNEKLAFTDENTVLFAERWTLLLILPLFLFIIIFIVGFFDEAKSIKRPIFKRNKQKKTVNKNEKKIQTITRIMIFSIGIISLFLAVGGILGRTCLLSNGHIKIYSITNSVKTEYTLGNYSKITFEYGRESVGKHDWRPACYFNIETNDGKEFDFCMNDSRYTPSDIGKNLENMLAIKEYYENNGIDVLINGTDKIEEIIQHYEMNKSEKELLYELFEIKN